MEGAGVVVDGGGAIGVFHGGITIAVQEEAVVVHDDQLGPGHDDARVCIIEPVCLDGHERVCVCGELGSVVHDGGGSGASRLVKWIF
jgi:hypothetical protein